MIYDYTRPILYTNEFEQKEAFDLKVKAIIVSNIDYPCIGLSYAGTHRVSMCLPEEQANAIPWPDLKAELFPETQINLYF